MTFFYRKPFFVVCDTYRCVQHIPDIQERLTAVFKNISGIANNSYFFCEYYGEKHEYRLFFCGFVSPTILTTLRDQMLFCLADEDLDACRLSRLEFSQTGSSNRDDRLFLHEIYETLAEYPKLVALVKGFEKHHLFEEK